MKKLFTVVTIGFMVLILNACSGQQNDKVIVKTNAGNITHGAFLNKLKESAGRQVLQQMVYEKILEKHYDSKQVEKQVDQQVQMNRKKQCNHFHSWLGSQRFSNVNQFREQLKLNLLLEKARTDGVQVTDKQMKSFYNKNQTQFTELKVIQILVDKKAKAQKIEHELKDGANFADLAKKESEDTDSAKKGGNLGYISDNSPYTMNFIHAAFTLKLGHISAPVQTPDGWHVIKVTDKKVMPFSKARSEIYQTLLQKKAKPMGQVLNHLSQQANIQVKDKAFKDVF